MLSDSVAPLLLLGLFLTLSGAQNLGLGQLFPSATTKPYDQLNCDTEQDRTVMETFSISCELVLTSLHDILLSKMNNSVLNSLGHNQALPDHYIFSHNQDLPNFGDNTTSHPTVWKVFIPNADETLEDSTARKDVCMALLKFDTFRHKCCYRLLESCPEYAVSGSGTTDSVSGSLLGSLTGNTGGGQPTDLVGGLLTTAVGNFVEMIKRQLGWANPRK